MDTILEVLTEAVIKALIIIIPIVFAVLTAYVIKFLQAQMAKLEREGKDFELFLLQEFAQIAVLAAEQVIGPGEGKRKYRFASRSLSKLAVEAGIPISENQALLLIEGTVHAIQNELPPTGYLTIGSTEEPSNVTA